MTGLAKPNGYDMICAPCIEVKKCHGVDETTMCYPRQRS
jgi:hypothetical protein